MDTVVYSAPPLFALDDTVEIDEAYMHWKAGAMTIACGNEVVSKEHGDWAVGLMSGKYGRWAAS